MRDAYLTLSTWQEEGIHFHDASLAKNGKPSDEERILESLALARHWQRESRSQRTRATNHALRKREGRAAGGRPPWYMKLKDCPQRKQKRAVLDERRVQLMFEMRRMRDAGAGYQEIAVAISKQLKPSFQPTPYTDASEYPLSRAQVWKLLQLEGWNRFANNPLLLAARGLTPGKDVSPWGVRTS